MIQNKSELRYFLEQDAIALRTKGRKRPKLFGDEVWKYQIILRKAEYYSNSFKAGKKRVAFHYFWYKFLLKRTSIRLGFSIPINVFGPGLSIAHYGTIVVNASARVGKNCRLQEGVNIGSTGGSHNAPKIGDNVFIGTGAKIIGDISIADGVVIGANAVVIKSIDEKNVTYGGVPAKKISSNNSYPFLAPELF